MTTLQILITASSVKINLRNLQVAPDPEVSSVWMSVVPTLSISFLLLISTARVPGASTFPYSAALQFTIKLTFLTKVTHSFI